MNADALAFLAAKGFTVEEIVEFARVSERKRDNTAAERQARYRAKKRPRNGVTVTAFPPIEDHTPVSPPPSSNDDGCAPAFDEKVVEVWNEGAEARGLAKARPLDPRRKAKLRLRVREQGEDGVLDGIRRIQASDFHCGLKPGSDWKADLPWLLKSPENMAKARDLPEPMQPAGPYKVDPEAGKAFERLRAGEISFEEFDKSRRTKATGPPRSIGQVLNAAAR